MSHPTKKALIKQIINVSSKFSNENLIRIMYLVEKIVREKDKSKARRLRALLKQNHPSLRLIRNILTNYDPNCVNKFINNFIIEGLMDNTGWREDQKKQGNAAPFTVLISPSMRCNLNCVGCYANSYSKKDDLGYELVNRVVKEAKELKTVYFTILGGEPFIWEDLFKLFKENSDCYFAVYTNGTLINDSLCQKLKQVGNVMPMLSIEGFEKKTDERRGKGVYKKVLAAMDLLKKHKILFGYSVCVTRKNQEIVFGDEFVDLMIEKGAIIGFYFLFMPVCGNPDMSLMPTPLQRVNMLERRNYIRGNKPLFIVDFWNDAPYVGGCIAGKYYFHITSKGDVEPCIFTHFAVDNIKEKSLKECLNSNYFKTLRKKQPFNENLLLPCQWIDNPEVSREMYEKFNLKSTHTGADDILTSEKLKKSMDIYAKEVKKLYDPIWEKGRNYWEKVKS